MDPKLDVFIDLSCQSFGIDQCLLLFLVGRVPGIVMRPSAATRLGLLRRSPEAKVDDGGFGL